jgi:hypothetical protein
MSYQIIELIRKNYCVDFLYGKFICNECKEKAFLSVKVNNKSYCGSCYDELESNNVTYVLPMPSISCKACGTYEVCMKTSGHYIYCESCFKNI